MSAVAAFPAPDAEPVPPVDGHALAPEPALSVVIITRNEAANIKACIDSVAFADEVVVLDNASTDDTAERARACGARVEVAPDWPGFGPQKNRALALARGRWVLSLDADERISPGLADEIRTVVRQDPQAVAYQLPRLTQFCGQWIRHCGWTPDHVLRLFKRGQARFSDDLVHEKVLLSPGQRLFSLRTPLLHFSYPTPAHYWRKLETYSLAWAAQRHAQGQRTSMPRAVVAAVAAFVRSYVLRRGFLDGSMGFAVCTMQAQAAFGKYFALYCLQRQSHP
jgi:glycosyltransferase involved in cell wall biosynthesis